MSAEARSDRLRSFRRKSRKSRPVRAVAMAAGGQVHIKPVAEKLEALSDAVFGFSMTLLVVSLDVPKTVAELFEVMQGFIAFAITFAILLMIWFNHYKFFRRYGLEDSTTASLNSVLLFVVVFFVYPLKFVFTVLVNAFMGRPVPPITLEEAITMMIIYGLGYVAIFLTFGLVYWHAYRKRKDLQLNEIEIFDTKGSLRENLIQTLVGVISIMIAWIGRQPAIAGWMYAALGPIMTFHGTWTGKRRRVLEEKSLNTPE